MPRRVVFSDPSTGRFVSSADALELDNAIRRVYDAGQLIEEQLLSGGTLVEDLTPSSEANWSPTPSRWGMSWTADDEPLNLSALQDAEFPADAVSFRVIYNIVDNPDYPRGFASSETLRPQQWPPSLDLVDGVAVTGIARVYFKGGQGDA